MKINGHKVKFKHWFSIVILKKTLTINYLIDFNPVETTQTRLIVMLTKANIPEEAVVITDLGVDNRAKIRAVWCSQNDLYKEIIEGAIMNGYKALTLKEMIDENNS